MKTRLQANANIQWINTTQSEWLPFFPAPSVTPFHGMIYHHDQGLHGNSLHKSTYKDTALSYFHVEKTFSSQNPCTMFACHSVRISQDHLCTKTSFSTFVHVQRLHSLHLCIYRECILFICLCTETAFSSYVHVQRLHSLQMSTYKDAAFSS